MTKENIMKCEMISLLETCQIVHSGMYYSPNGLPNGVYCRLNNDWRAFCKKYNVRVKDRVKSLPKINQRWVRSV